MRQFIKIKEKQDLDTFFKLSVTESMDGPTFVINEIFKIRIYPNGYHKSSPDMFIYHYTFYLKISQNISNHSVFIMKHHNLILVISSEEPRHCH